MPRTLNCRNPIARLIPAGDPGPIARLIHAFGASDSHFRSRYASRHSSVSNLLAMRSVAGRPSGFSAASHPRLWAPRMSATLAAGRALRLVPPRIHAALDSAPLEVGQVVLVAVPAVRQHPRGHPPVRLPHRFQPVGSTRGPAHQQRVAVGGLHVPFSCALPGLFREGRMPWSLALFTTSANTTI